MKRSIVPAEAEDRADTDAEIALSGLVEVGQIESRFDANADQSIDAHVDGDGEQRSEFGLVKAEVADCAQLAHLSRSGGGWNVDLSEDASDHQLERALHPFLI